MMKRLLIISSWFQIIWFLAVVGQYSWQWLTLALAVMTFVATAFATKVPWFKVLLIFAIGVSVDWLNMSLGALKFEHGSFPVWLFSLWLIFIWYSYFLYPLLSQYPISLVSMVGGVGGALSYIAGEKLGAVTFGLPLITTSGILLIEWTILIALIIRVYGYETHHGNNKLPTTDREC